MPFFSGQPETMCGKGSTLEATAEVREKLPALLTRLGVEKLLDAPCGDFNWMRLVVADLPKMEYFGVDFDEMHIAKARTSMLIMKLQNCRFKVMDVVNARLPAADAVFSRDFFQHVTDDMALRALEGFRATGARLLIATSHETKVNSDIDVIGGFRPIDLSKSPFNLGMPSEILDDPVGSGRILGVWNLR